MQSHPPYILIIEPGSNPIDAVSAIDPRITPESATIISIQPDGTSIKIEQIKDLRRSLQFTGSSGRVIIFHSFELATLEAQNALLKILEDLSEVHSFFLCTTRCDAVIPTIRSRCLIGARPSQKDAIISEEMNKVISEIEQGNCTSILGSPVVQATSLEAAREILVSCIAVLQPKIRSGDMWAVHAVQYAFEILSLSRSNNLNAQMSIDAWIIKAATTSQNRTILKK
ncbi:hypothetical protein KBD81_05590 [Candidatus Woesebacteria bacterium]|nr:hypothetical protein [Candidatus Woesebacteria bacterium]